MSRQWWDQKGIDWKTAKERAAETDSESESKMEKELEVEAEPERREYERSTSSGVIGSSEAEWSGAIVDP